MRYHVKELLTNKAFYKISKTVFLHICTILLISGLMFIVYFSLSYKDFFAESIASLQKNSLNKIQEQEFSAEKLATQILSEYSIINILHSGENDDLTYTADAMSFIKSLKLFANIDSLHIIDNKQSFIWTDTSMVAKNLNLSLEKKDILNNYMSGPNTFVSIIPNKITYIYNSSSYSIFMHFSKTYFYKNYIENNGMNSETWLYNNKQLLYETTKQSNNIFQNKELNEKKHNNNYEKHIFFHRGSFYVCSFLYTYSYITKIQMIPVIFSLFGSSLFIWITALLLTLIAMIILNFLNKHINQHLKTYNSKLESLEHTAKNNIMTLTLKKIFSGTNISNNEKNLITDVLKDNKQYISIVFHIKNYKELLNQYSTTDISLYQYGINNISNEILSKHYNCISTSLNSRDIGFLLSGNSFVDINDIITNITTALSKYLDSISGLWLVNSSSTDINELIIGAQDTPALAQYTFADSSCIIVSENSIKDKIPKYPTELQQEFYTAFSSKNMRIIDDLFMQFTKYVSGLPRSIVENWIISIMLNAINTIPQHNNLYLISDLIIKFKDFDNLSEAIEYIKQLLNFEELYKQPKSDFKSEIEQLIFNNYSNPDFDLFYVSNELNMNTAYLGRKFHTLFEKSFSKYLTEFRILKACHLIVNTDMRIKDIAFNCGFRQLPYFVTVFKNYTKMTPSEYRNSQANIKSPHFNKV